MNRPTEDEINNLLNACVESENEGESKYPGMTYEQGIKDAIMWMQGEAENPLAD